MPASISYRISDGQSRSPTSVSLFVSPMHVHSRALSRVSCPVFCWLCGFGVVFGCCLVLFWPLSTQETLPNAAQADMCTSCMNGGSTRAKKVKDVSCQSGTVQFKCLWAHFALCKHLHGQPSGHSRWRTDFLSNLSMPKFSFHTNSSGKVIKSHHEIYKISWSFSVFCVLLFCLVLACFLGCFGLLL